MDALIELSDENADWKLSFDEFLNCMKPGFNPPEKSERRSVRRVFKTLVIHLMVNKDSVCRSVSAHKI